MTDDFTRIIATATTLVRIGDKEGAKGLLKTAEALMPLSKVGLCGKCCKRMDRQTEALAQVKAQLHDGAADGKAVEVAATGVQK